jgi:hypothetical protein
MGVEILILEGEINASAYCMGPYTDWLQNIKMFRRTDLSELTI